MIENGVNIDLHLNYVHFTCYIVNRNFAVILAVFFLLLDFKKLFRLWAYLKLFP